MPAVRPPGPLRVRSLAPDSLEQVAPAGYGAARSAAALEREIRRPAEVIPVGFETVTVVGKDGRKIRGVRKNEDTFSVQIMTASEEILSFSKKEVEVTPELDRSLMPAYGPERLSAGDLDDVVRYLRALRGERGTR